MLMLSTINKWGKFISFLIRSRSIWTIYPLTEWFIFFDGKLNFQQISICIFPSILSTMSKWLPFWFLANSFKALFYYYYCVNYCLKHTVYNTTLHVSEAAPTGSGSVVSLCEYLSCILRSDQSHRTELSQL